MMMTLEQQLRRRESMWYPACGNDLRPLHHVAFNNLFINPKWFILNDVNPELDLTPIERIEGVTVHAIVRSELDGCPVQLIKIIMEVSGRLHMKDIIYFPMTNRDVHALLARKRIHPKTALLHRVNDAYELMEIGWLQAFNELQVKYCYVDIRNLLFDGPNLDFVNNLQQLDIRYISEQSYSGFQFSRPDCFESTIHLFELRK